MDRNKTAAGMDLLVFSAAVFIFKSMPTIGLVCVTNLFTFH